ncbi:NADH-quinone oxidoreductase subunit H [Bremerella volcania]|uniref:NADH-quinone oxidoreductase subunit H n=1 Tax=Bremerella volcania TaxID=2527984 RepID=A0A518CEC8_9BACT|nr:NADH-quinone oxidoreductase subunit NuoH [Bremerella volcania]QDU77569.1 NADH-quinone oxidoreductase subunit H [Bremerella volcania]
MGEFFAGWFPAGWEFLGYTVAALIQAFLLVNVIALGAFVFIWAERKVSARIQDRLGPTRTGGAFGWLQSLADGIKLLSKEDLMPKDADPILFKLAPYVAFAASFSAFMALPFASGWVALHLNIGLFFLIAVLGLEVFGVILAGYSSGSKWSLFGAMRQAAQVVSYEVPLGICVIVPLMICGTMDLVAIGDQQRGLFTNWLIFHDPFIFVVFWVYFTCAVASVNRAPFDLAEAESELVAGFLTEYSGMRWSLFFMAEYGSMILVSALAAILFFGGWNGPIPIFSALMDWFPNYLGNCWWFSTTANLFGLLCLLMKASIGVIAMMWVRWTFPRLRVDQVITMCLKYCVPIAAVCLLGVMFWTALGVPFFNDLLPAQDRALVREGWFKSGEKQADALLKSLSPSPDEEGEVE